MEDNSASKLPSILHCLAAWMPRLRRKQTICHEEITDCSKASLATVRVHIATIVAKATILTSARHVEPVWPGWMVCGLAPRA
jgi:hypothetical protein